MTSKSRQARQDKSGPELSNPMQINQKDKRIKSLLAAVRELYELPNDSRSKLNRVKMENQRRQLRRRLRQ